MRYICYSTKKLKKWVTYRAEIVNNITTVLQRDCSLRANFTIHRHRDMRGFRSNSNVGFSYFESNVSAAYSESLEHDNRGDFEW